MQTLRLACPRCQHAFELRARAGRLRRLAVEIEDQLDARGALRGPVLARDRALASLLDTALAMADRLDVEADGLD